MTKWGHAALWRVRGERRQARRRLWRAGGRSPSGSADGVEWARGPSGQGRYRRRGGKGTARAAEVPATPSRRAGLAMRPIRAPPTRCGPT